MKIAFVTECDYELSGGAEGCDLVVFPFFRGGAVSYDKEIKGATNFFRTLTNLSKRLKSTVIAGCDTDSYGMIRHSAAVCDGGKLLGISDMTTVAEKEKYVGGGTLRVYDTRAGKIGLAVGWDSLSSEVVKTLALCGADVIVNVADTVLGGITGVSARAKAYEFGVPIAVCAYRNAMLCGVEGEMVFSSPQKVSVATVGTGKDYHLVTLRRRGKKYNGENSS
ncbi:MAG: carbon-nitrogen hydrolase family protein [Clostridia bacterium]|nr:carbon-nitrogen hydrolase family protein [Clostridia bacterium]